MWRYQIKPLIVLFRHLHWIRAGLWAPMIRWHAKDLVRQALRAVQTSIERSIHNHTHQDERNQLVSVTREQYFWR